MVLRDNLQNKLRALAALQLAPSDVDTPLFEHVCATVLQQAHLSPTPLDFQVWVLSVSYLPWHWDLGGCSPLAHPRYGARLAMACEGARKLQRGGVYLE